MTKTFTSLLGATLLAAAISAQAAPLRVTKQLPGGLDERSMTVVAPGEEAPASPLTEALSQSKIKGLFIPTSTAETINARAARSATAAARALKGSLQLLGYLNTGGAGLNASTFYYLPVGENTAADNFKALSKFSWGGNLEYGAYYDTENFTAIAPKATISEMSLPFGNITNVSLSGFYTIDLKTGKATANDNIYSGYEGAIAKGMAADPGQPGKAYGVYGYKDDMDWMPLYWAWSCVDYDAIMSASGSLGKDQIKVIRKMLPEEDQCPFVCADANGEYYGINKAGELKKIDKLTGEMTLVGQTGVDAASEKGGASFDSVSGSMVVYTINADNSGAKLYEVNLASGETSVAATYDTAWNFTNLVIFPALAEDKAPAAPMMLINNVAGSMDIEYSVTLPTTLYDGTPLTGAVDWQITANGNVIIEGRNTAGSALTGNFTLTEGGLTEFVCTAINDEGPSPKATQTIFIGPGTPGYPSNVHFYHTNGTAYMAWTAPYRATDGGPVDFSALTYIITDEDGKEMTRVTGATDCSFALAEPAEPTTYTFYVVADNNGKLSEPSEPRAIQLGKVWDTPYTPDLGVEMVDFGTIGWTQPLAPDLTNNMFAYWYSGSGVTGATINVYSQVNQWLFTADVKLEGGKIHMLDFDINGSNNKMVTMEVYAGKNNTPEAMTTQVMEMTGVAPISYGNMTHYSYPVMVDEDGVYNIGFHVDSYNAGNWIAIENMVLSAGFLPGTPDAPLVRTVERSADGSNQYTITADLPGQTVDHQEVTDNYTVELLCDGKVVKTITDVEPAGRRSFTGTVPEAGNHDLGMRLVLDDKTGPTNSMKAYVGPYPYEAPANVNLFRGTPDGAVTLTWNPVSKDIDGVDQPAGTATYMVYGVSTNIYGETVIGEPMLKEPVSTCYATFQAVPAGKQEYVQYVVGALNRGVDPINFTGSPYRAVGTPYAMPVMYSNDLDLENYIAGTSVVLPAGVTTVDTSKVYFTLVGDGQLQGVDSSDSDGVFLMSFSQYQNYGNDFFTGIIDLKGTTEPQLIFDLNKLTATDANEVKILARYEDREELVTNVNRAAHKVGWNPVVVDLKPYVGKNVEFVIRCLSQTYTMTCFDNIRFVDRKKFDVGVRNITAPDIAKLGEKFSVYAMIENNGSETAQNFTATLLRDGKEIDSRTIESLNPLDMMSVGFQTLIDLFDEDAISAHYSVKLALAGDEFADNDCSDETYVERRVYRLPAVTDLYAEAVEKGAQLTWTSYAHDPSNVITWVEDFEGEKVAHGDNEFDGWTFLDGDGNLLGGISINNSLLEIPNHEAFTSTSSFFIWDWDDPLVPKGGWFSAHSGAKMLINLYTVVPNGSDSFDFGEIDDWMISPELSGNAQTISFWARPFEVHYAELLEVYYSTEDSTDPADFIKLGETIELPVNNNMLSNEGDWEQYFAELPAGAKRFAIRCISEDGMMCCIDDVEYESCGGPKHKLVGYDVYRNGQKINDATVGEGSFLDTTVEPGDHTYHVIANYAAGKSELSNPAYISVSGVENVVAAPGASVTVENRDIVVTCAASLPVSIATTDGRLLKLTSGNTRLSVAPGIYLVSVGGTTTKLFVP